MGATDMLAVALPVRWAIATYSEEQAESAKTIATAPVKLPNFPRVIVRHKTPKTDIGASAAKAHFVRILDVSEAAVGGDWLRDSVDCIFNCSLL